MSGAARGVGTTFGDPFPRQWVALGVALCDRLARPNSAEMGRQKSFRRVGFQLLLRLPECGTTRGVGTTFGDPFPRKWVAFRVALRDGLARPNSVEICRQKLFSDLLGRNHVFEQFTNWEKTLSN